VEDGRAPEQGRHRRTLVDEGADVPAGFGEGERPRQGLRARRVVASRREAEGAEHQRGDHPVGPPAVISRGQQTLQEVQPLGAPVRLRQEYPCQGQVVQLTPVTEPVVHREPGLV
jgi:hypothetical protein